jgi:hypothetical protein
MGFDLPHPTDESGLAAIVSGRESLPNDDRHFSFAQGSSEHRNCFSLAACFASWLFGRFVGTDLWRRHLENFRFSSQPILVRVAASFHPDVVRALTNAMRQCLIHGAPLCLEQSKSDGAPY